jgi:hypothetical protein
MAGVNVRVLLIDVAARFVNKCCKMPEMAHGKRIMSVQASLGSNARRLGKEEFDKSLR